MRPLRLAKTQAIPATGRGVALRRDASAASPLVVIVTFVLVAVLITVVLYALVFDRPEADVELVTVRPDGTLAFDVTHTSGSLEWSEVRLTFLDRSGTDVAAAYLHLPEGSIEREDRVSVEPLPPAGTYLLLVHRGEDELSRLAVTL